jgi:predicted dehydrogenase
VSSRLRVGVIGCGVIAQVMHLQHLNELDDLYELAALCDLSESVLDACSQRFGPAATYTDADAMLSDQQLDVVMVLTAGSHARHAIAAADAGCHVFVEKPMCYGLDEGRDMLEAVRRAGVRLMVGTHKRYDPAYERLLEHLPLPELPFVQSTTLQAPWQPHVHAYPIAYPEVTPPALERLRAEDEQLLVDAYPEGTPEERYNYRWTLLDDLVHELNMLRGAIGEPDRVDFAAVSRTVTLISLTFGDTTCHMSWLFAEDGMARYKQELAFVGMDRRLILSLPSPYLRAMPSQFAIEGGTKDSPHAWRTVETLSYEEAFRRELVEFEAAIREGREPLTNTIDGLRDVALCAAIADVHRTREPIEQPSALPEWAGTASVGA